VRGIGIQIEHPATLRHGGGEISDVFEIQHAVHPALFNAKRGDSCPVRESQCRTKFAIAHGRHSINRSPCRPTHEVVGRKGCTKRQPDRQHRLRRHARPLTSQRGWCCVEDRFDRVVELAKAGEAGRKGHIGETHRGCLDKRPCRLGSLGTGDGNRWRSNCVDHDATQMPLGYRKVAGEISNRVFVQVATVDLLHGSGHDIVAQIPLR